MSKISLHISSVLRHRHTLEEECQQTDYQLIDNVEMSELKYSLFPTTYLNKKLPNILEVLSFSLNYFAYFCFRIALN